MDKKEYIETTDIPAVIYLPENAIEMKMDITVWHESKPVEVTVTYDMKKLQEFFRDAEENYIAPDTRFVLTEKGRELVKSLGWDD